eukprot:m.43018 g.43018  ORF g.43018 m.43018 type:complete len:88 (+) comp6349_c0_seq2:1700-1963(+)
MVRARQCSFMRVPWCQVRVGAMAYQRYVQSTLGMALQGDVDWPETHDTMVHDPTKKTHILANVPWRQTVSRGSVMAVQITGAVEPAY